MIHTGMCSVTFRDLSPDQVIELTAEAKLDGVEWGGDVHVPPDTPPCADQTVQEATEKAGLVVASYGSYYNVLKSDDHPKSFPPVLDTAQALGTRVVRIWCGGGDSADADESAFQLAAERTAELGRMAAERNITLAFEFHTGGLTDSVPTTVKLLQMIDEPNVRTYFQDLKRDAPAPADDLRELLPYVQNVHCQYGEGGKRCALEKGKERWSALLGILRESDFDGFVLIEFTADNKPESFLRDAATLREILGRD